MSSSISPRNLPARSYTLSRYKSVVASRTASRLGPGRRSRVDMRSGGSRLSVSPKWSSRLSELELPNGILPDVEAVRRHHRGYVYVDRQVPQIDLIPPPICRLCASGHKSDSSAINRKPLLGPPSAFVRNWTKELRDG